jgi:ADP-ribosylglycohydrolase
MGTTAEPLNDSKGCGGVMRAAPAGLFLAGDPQGAYRLGCDLAAMTHGHPDGWHSAGCLAAMVAVLADGGDLPAAVEEAVSLTSEPMRDGLTQATAVARRGLPGAEDIESRLGEGWVGDEALAIAVSCALAAPDARSAVVAAVNHSGDSDSTGSICGNLVGARYGEAAIPARWLEQLDAGDLVDAVAGDVVLELTDPPGGVADPVPEWWWDRYPGW